MGAFKVGDTVRCTVPAWRDWRGTVVAEPYGDALPTGAQFVPCRTVDGDSEYNLDSRVLEAVR
jgi:hypothetical protein